MTIRLRVVDYPVVLRDVKKVLQKSISRLLNTSSIEIWSCVGRHEITARPMISWDVFAPSSNRPRDVLLKLRLHEGYKLVIEATDRDVFETVVRDLENYTEKEGKWDDLDVTIAYHDNDTQ